MGHRGIVTRIVGGELKLVLFSVMVGIVCGAVIWERHGDQVKAWLGEHGIDCPLCQATSSDSEVPAN